MNPNGFEVVAASPKLNPSSISLLFCMNEENERGKSF
jgi:hypothetical protein